MKLPVLLPSTLRKKGRVNLPAELLDKVSWLAAARTSRVEVGLEVFGIGHVRIVPRTLVDSAIAAEADMLGPLVRRLFASHIEDDHRLVLPPLFEGRLFPNWSNDKMEYSLTLECHEDYVSILTTEAWMTLVAADQTLGQLLSKSSM